MYSKEVRIVIERQVESGVYYGRFAEYSKPKLLLAVPYSADLSDRVGRTTWVVLTNRRANTDDLELWNIKCYSDNGRWVYLDDWEKIGG